MVDKKNKQTSKPLKNSSSRRIIAKVLFAGIIVFAILIFTLSGCTKNQGSSSGVNSFENSLEKNSVEKADEKTEQSVAQAQIVNGVQKITLSWGKLNYNPEIMKVKQAMPVQITADTERLQGCFRSISIPDLGITKSFTEVDNTLEFTPQKKGTFQFGCSMGMGAGTIVVE